MDDLDRLDAELIDDVLRMPGYALIQGRMAETAQRLIRQLVTNPGDQANMHELRGRILGLETAAGLPKILIEEAKTRDQSRR